MCFNVFLITGRTLPANKNIKLYSKLSYHINHSHQNKGHFVSKQCIYSLYIKECCTGKVVVKYLVLMVQSPFFLCSGHTSKITCDKEHCTQPTIICLPIRARLKLGIRRRVRHVGNWQAVTYGHILIKIKVVIVANSQNMLLIKGKHVFSMLCKMMKHVEVILWRNQGRHHVLYFYQVLLY